MGTVMRANHFVYVLECADGSYYTGYTNDLDRRVEAHQLGKGAKYTRGRTPVKLIYHETYDEQTEAMRREYAIKQLTKPQKRMLTKGMDMYEDTKKL